MHEPPQPGKTIYITAYLQYLALIYGPPQSRKPIGPTAYLALMHGPPQSGKPTLPNWPLCTDLHNLENLHYCLIGPYARTSAIWKTHVTANLALNVRTSTHITAFLALMHGPPQSGKPTLLPNWPVYARTSTTWQNYIHYCLLGPHVWTSAI